jgi:hypothetical protein
MQIAEPLGPAPSRLRRFGLLLRLQWHWRRRLGIGARRRIAGRWTEASLLCDKRRFFDVDAPAIADFM